MLTTHDQLLVDIPAVLDFWGLEPTSISVVPGGTLNFNFEIATASGRFFLRCHRSDVERERIVGEHELLSWLAERGIPAPRPIPASTRETLVAHRDHEWALFPWIAGRSVERGALSPEQATALGAVHGRIQEALARHPGSAGARFEKQWDAGRSLELLGQVGAQARSQAVQPWIVAGIERHRGLLSRAEILPPSHFAALPCQLLHGDFHDEQVLFDGDRVVAVVDWEIWHTDARAWELIRSLSFSKLLDSPRLEDYLAGYGEHVRLTEDELQLALTLWFQSRLVGLWAWWAYVMEGNERVARFFPAMLTEFDHISDMDWQESVRSRVVDAATR